MKNKDFNKLVFALVASSMVLSGCGNAGFSKKSMEKEKVALIAKAPEFKVKETKYQLDETTEVLIDKIFKKEDIKKIVKHGDHWHIWTKDNVEHITYTNPDEMEDEAEIEAVNVVSADSLSEKSDEVVKILQHGDHYHIYTSSGKEYISYENPKANYPKAYFGQYEGEHGKNDNPSSKKHEKPVLAVPKSGSLREKIEKLEVITVFGQEKVDRYDVVKVLKHGDHYHIYDRKGREGILYVNPENLYPTAEFGEYIGEHGKKEKALKTKEEDKNKVIKILQHGDHYHIYTLGGEEYISYENPRERFPDAEFGQYEGSHGEIKKEEKKEKKKETDKKAEKNKKKRNLKKKKKTEKKEKDESKKESEEKDASLQQAIEELNIVNLLGKPLVDRFDIVKILQHGDHYHIYDSKGNEGILYVNPEKLYPNATFGQYEGSHGDKKEEGLKKNGEKEKTEGKEQAEKDGMKKGEGGGQSTPKEKEKSDGSRVVQILVHGDHYHIYTEDGREYITYSDPRSLYPDASFGVYTGSHGDEKTDEKKPENGKKENEGKSNQGGASSNDSGNPSGGNSDSSEEKRIAEINALQITGILGKKAVNRFDIVKILQHENHYHIFDSKNNEGIVYVNPKSLYPNATFGQYEGSHGGNTGDTGNNTPIVWPEGITKIVDHGDHWHLWKDGKEVGVVNVNPRDRYPKAEYIVEKTGNSTIQVEDSELFTYESVEPKMADGISKFLSDNLKSMTHFGAVPRSDIPTYGSDGQTENVFYWLHNDHYHAITIKQIIQNAKADEYGNYTATQVVASMKAKIENKASFDEEVIDSRKNEAIQKYLKMGFNLSKDSDVEFIKNQITVYLAGGKTLKLHADDFDERNGFIRSKKSLDNNFTENDVTVIRDEVADSSKEVENKRKLKKLFEQEDEDVAILLVYDFMSENGVKAIKIEELEIQVENRKIIYKESEYSVPEDYGKEEEEE